MHSLSLYRKQLRRIAASITTIALSLGLINVSSHAQGNGSMNKYKEKTMTKTTATQQSNELSADESIRPFKVSFSDAELTDLRNRIKATRWPDREQVNDDTQGVRLATMHKLADYWANNYDWRKIETKINSYPNFVTNIDGLDIHFIHVK